VKSDLPYLQHIADSIATIETYVSGGREVFLSERLISSCLGRCREESPAAEICGKASVERNIRAATSGTVVSAGGSLGVCFPIGSVDHAASG
jgi:hypothetical protein